MADSGVDITAGSGTTIDTRTEGTNSNHRQVIVIGDPATNAGVAPVDVTAGLKVDLGADNDVVVTNAGTFAVQASIAAAQTLATVTTVGTVSTITNVVHVDDNASSLTVDNAGTFAVQAAQSGTWTVQPGNTANTTAWKVDGSAVTQPVSGTVTVNALPAGTNNIGDVDVLSIIPGTGATNLGKAIDTATGATDTGVLAIATRDDALSALTPIEGDNVQLRVDANGALWTAINNTITVASHAVTNAGTFATQVDGAALTSLQLIDDIVYTDDTSTHATGTSKGALFMAAATPTDTAVNANDIGAVAMTTDRKLHVSVQDALPAGTAAIGKLAANSGVDIGDVDITSIAAGDNNIGNVDIVSVPADPFGANADAASATGSISAKLRFIASTGIPVTGTVTVGSHAVTNAGTFAVQNTPAQVATATVTALASAATSAQLLASTAGRRGLLLTNTDANGVYVKLGTTASATDFSVFIPGGDTTNGFGYWEMPAPIYTGRIDAIWAADGSGSLLATELT